GITSVVRTRGNPDGHLVLRGGRGATNHRPADIERAAALARTQGVVRPVMVDCSHANSGQDPRRQKTVCQEVIAQLDAAAPALLGLLLESNLVEGRQDWAAGASLRYGVSITDACMGWDDTAALLDEIAGAVARRPARAAQ